MTGSTSPSIGRDRVPGPDDLAAWLDDAADYVLSRPLELVLHDKVQIALERLSEAADTQQAIIACYHATGTPTPGPTDLAYQAQGMIVPGAVVVRHEHMTYGELVQNMGNLPPGAIAIAWEGGDIKHCTRHAYEHAATRSWPAEIQGHVIYAEMLTPSDVINCVACPRGVPSAL